MSIKQTKDFNAYKRVEIIIQKHRKLRCSHDNVVDTFTWVKDLNISSLKNQQFASIFLSYDNFSLNCVQPTNYIELEKLAFPLQSNVFLQYLSIIGGVASETGYLERC